MSDGIRSQVEHLIDYLKKQWEIRNSRQRWHLVYMVGKLASNIIGVTVYDDMKLYWYSFIPGFCGLFHTMTIFYTVGKYFLQNEYKRGLECTCVGGMVIAVLTVYYETVTSGRFMVNSLINMPGKYFYANDKGSSIYHTICDKNIFKLYYELGVWMLMICASFSLAGLSGIYAILFVDHRYTLLDMEIPFVDSRTISGYATVIAYQVFISLFYLLSSIAIEVGVVLIYNAFEMMPSLIRFRAGELNSELNLNGQTYKAMRLFQDVCQEAEDFDGYIRACRSVYYIRLFVGPIISMYSISFSIFGQMILGYPTGYGVALCNYMLLYIFCKCGENGKTTQENILLELYDMQWYMLTPSQQRQLCSVLHYTQNANMLTLGPFGTLDFETFANMSRSIFRWTIALKNLFLS